MGRTGHAVPQVSHYVCNFLRKYTNEIRRFSGTESSVKDNLRSARELARSCQCQNFEAAQSEADMESLWSARKQALWASLAVRPEGTQVWSTDVAVPISRMAELISEFLCSMMKPHRGLLGPQEYRKTELRGWASLQAC